MAFIDEIRLGEDAAKYKLFVWAGLILFFVTVVGAIFMAFFKSETMVSSVEAAVYLMSTLPPLIVLLVIMQVVSSQMHKVEVVTEELLVRDLPFALSKLRYPKQVFIEYGKAALEKSLYDNSSRVCINFKKGDFCADYVVFLNWGGVELKLYVRVEANIKRINVNVGFERDFVDLIGSELWSSDAFYRDLLPHTFFGAEGDKDYEYIFNPNIFVRSVSVSDSCSVFKCMVGTISVPEDFMQKRSERVYFCQDLVLMVRSMLDELRGKILEA